MFLLCVRCCWSHSPDVHRTHAPELRRVSTPVRRLGGPVSRSRARVDMLVVVVHQLRLRAQVCPEDALHGTGAASGPRGQG